MMNQNDMKKIIKTENLRYAYRAAEGELPKIVLEDLDLEIEAGTFVAHTRAEWFGQNDAGQAL